MVIDAILSLVFLFLAILLYVLLAVAITGGTLAVAGLCTGLLVGAPAYPLLKRLPTVRRPFSHATESLTGDGRIDQRNRAFVALYVGCIGLYSVVYLILLAQAASALWSGYPYRERYPVLLVAAGVIVAGSFIMVNSDRFRRLEPPLQPLLEWLVFVVCVTALCTVTVPGVLFFVLKALYVVI